MSIVIIKDNLQFDAFTPTRFLGSGASGCVLLGTLDGVQCVFKCVLNQTQDDILTVKREVFIGQQLKSNKVPPQISEMFISTTSLYISSIGIPESWIKMMDADCKKKFKTSKKKPKRVCILVQDFVDNIEAGHKWLGARANAVSANCIRAILFQITLALSYAQSAIGFQHNDLKLENIMFVPVKTHTVLEYFINKYDLFKVTLEAGDVLVRFIDFGASSIRLKGDVPDFLKTAMAHTPAYLPFEFSLVSSEVTFDVNRTPLSSRHYDADCMGVFHIFMNLLCHQRAEVYPTEIWVYEVKPTGGIDAFAPLNDSVRPYDDGSIAHIQPLYELFAKCPILNNDDGFDSETFEFVLTLWALYVAFDMVPGYADECIRCENATTKKAIDEVYAIILTDKFYDLFNTLEESPTTGQIPSKAANMWIFLPALLKTVFGNNRAAQSFMENLVAPTAQSRAAFGVPKYPEYLLSTALYHPFLAYAYWDTQVVPSMPAGSLPETDMPFKFSTSTTDASIRAEIDTFDIKFGDTLKNAVPAPAPTPASGANPLITPAIAENTKLLAIDMLKLYVFAGNDAELTKRYKTITPFVKGVHKPFLAHALTFADEDERKDVTEFRDDQTAVLDGYNYIQDDDEDHTPLVPSAAQYNEPKRATNRSRICAILLDVAAGAYVLYENPLDEPSAIVAKTFFTRATERSTKSNVKDDGSEKFTKFWTDNKTLEPERQLLERIFGRKDLGALLTEKYNSNEIQSELPDMISNLESIERLFEFKTDDVYDMKVIQAQLYEPLREHALVDEHLAGRVVPHLGLESEQLFGSPVFATIDMASEQNQTRYFHTLSIVANMIHSRDYTEIERCFVEWPPKAAVRPGEVFEI